MVNAVTINTAAERLGVTPQRVSQMLKDGELCGPRQGPGRASRNALRVYLDSLETVEQRRAAGQSLLRSKGGRERTFQDDAHRLKIALDVARDQVARHRRQNERLTKLLAEAVAALQEEQTLSRDADRIAEEYAAVATNHLAPDGLSRKS